MHDDFVSTESSLGDIKIASITWGFQLGFTLLTAAKAAGQTLGIWRRTGQMTGYMFMIWLEIIVNTILGTLSWFYIEGRIPPRYVFPSIFAI